MCACVRACTRVCEGREALYFVLVQGVYNWISLVGDLVGVCACLLTRLGSGSTAAAGACGRKLGGIVASGRGAGDWVVLGSAGVYTPCTRQL